HALAEVLAGLHDPDGRVAVAGFYDGIPPLTAARRAEVAAVPFDEAAYVRDLGLSEPHGEPGYSTLERLWERPTLEVNGVRGGRPRVLPPGARPRSRRGARADQRARSRAPARRSPGAGGHRRGARPRLHDRGGPPGDPG